jgi:ADP-ribose pyrophosphatase
MNTNFAEERKNLEENAKNEIHTIYKGKVLEIEKDIIFLDNKEPFERGIVHHPGAAAVIPITDDNKIILTKQYRRAVKQIILEIPAGILEKNEPVIDTAQRELREEVGFRAKTLLPIAKYYSSPGFSDELIHLYIGRGLTKDPLPKDKDEAIDVLFCEEKYLLDLIKKNQIVDSKTLIALLYYFNWKNHEKS